MSSYGTETIKTISQTGEIPECRMENARAVQDWCRRLIDNDDKRAYKRSRVNGLVDGNPPFRLSALREAGRAGACNVNWGVAKAYMESAAGAFYDLFSEAPGYFNIITYHGIREKRVEYSRIMSEEADRIVQQDPTWDYEMQRSQDQMVLHGCGPFLFEDIHDILPRAANTGDLKVPEFTKSDTHYWDACMIQVDYYPPELYKLIRNPEAATKRGWDTDYTQAVIANAMDVRTQPGIRYEWEFYQQELKNNSLMYYDDSKINRLAHAFWREFDGRITHVIVERDTTVATNNQDREWITKTLRLKDLQKDGVYAPDVQYLFKHVGRYKDWHEAVHPMYYDRGNGGYHHSVTGLGVKMYAALEWQNRALCNASDKAFSPKTLFKPTSTEATQRFQMTHHGDYGLLPAGYDIVQNPIAGMLQEILTWNEEINNILGSNLSQYKQHIPAQTSGNPPTKFQKMMEAQQQAALSATTFNRYYKQLDILYSEIVRRLCNLNSSNEKAKEYQECCHKRGVPYECFDRIAKVEAVRVVGKGSTFMRKMAIDSLLPYAGSLPEEGRDNLLADKVATEAGQGAVGRYIPIDKKQKQTGTEQQAQAMLQVSGMKVGVPPVITSSQDPMVFAAAFIAAGMQAVQSIKQGGNPSEVVQFLGLDGPAAMKHLQRFSSDPTRKPAYDQLLSAWKQLASATDQIKAMAQRNAAAQKAQAAKSSGVMTDEQIKAAKAQNDMRLKTMKTQHQLQLNEAKTRQQLALNDASTASEIDRKNRMASLTE